MARGMAAGVAGYLVMALLVFGLLTAAYFALGADRAFRPGTYDVSPLWIAVWLVVSLGAAVAGGWVCRSIARNVRTGRVLAGVVLVLGLVSALAVQGAASDEPAPARDVNVTNMEAMMRAKSPLWISFANPIVGLLGVLVGSELISGRARQAREESA